LHSGAAEPTPLRREQKSEDKRNVMSCSNAHISPRAAVQENCSFAMIAQRHAGSIEPFSIKAEHRFQLSADREKRYHQRQISSYPIHLVLTL
jgi:hypothetical protein